MKPFLQFAVLAMAAGLATATAQERVLTSNAIVAAVENEMITILDVDNQIRPELQAAMRQYRSDELARKIEQLRRDAAMQLVENELLYAEFKRREFKLPPELVQKRIDAIVLAEAGGSRERFEKNLFDKGMSFSEFTQKVQKMVATELMVDEFVRRPVHVGPAEVRDYYEKNLAEFTRPNRLRLAMILLKGNGKYAGKLDETAARIREQLAEKADFGWLAKQYSEAPTAAAGGDLGWMPEADVQKDFLTAVRTLPKGEVAAPLRLGENLVVLKVLDREELSVPVLDEALGRKIENRLKAKLEHGRYEDLIAKLKKQYRVTLFF